MTRGRKEYIGLSHETNLTEAHAIQQRIETRRRKGQAATSDMVWAWIKERRPSWQELDWEKVFQLVKLD